MRFRLFLLVPFLALLAGAAQAGCTNIPHVFANHTVADGPQVNDNFNALSACAMPHIATEALLAATATSVYTTGVWRDDYSAGLGAPALFYLPSNAACPLNAGAGDGGAQVRSADGKCWLAKFVPDDFNPQYWGADRTAAVDSTAAILAAATWIGANRPGGRLNCGGYGNHYLIGTNAQANTPLFALTHAVNWYGCYFVAAAMTTTTDIWSISPTMADTDGWGWEYVTVYSPLNTPKWRNTWRFDDGGDNTKFIRGLKFHDILVYPSQNRTGADFDVEATDVGTGLLVQSTLGPNVAFFESFTCTHCGDSINVNGFTIATDGAISTAKTCFAVSLTTSGAGEFAITDFNCTAYGGMVFTNTYGLHLRGGVLELQSSSLPAANNSFITLTGAIDSSFDHVQVQAGAVVTPPGVLFADAGVRGITGHFILSSTAVAPYQINAAAAGTTSITDNVTVCPNTLTTFTSGTGATYTTPTCNGGRPQLLDITMVGGGGGGFGSGTAPGVATSGTNTVFDTFSAGAGTSASGTPGGAGGTVSGCTDNLAGQAGGYGNNATVQVGGIGGSSPYFTGGAVQVGAATNGGAATVNSGGGGAGAGSGATAPAGGGGGSGAVCHELIASPAASYLYTVGAAGSGGTAGAGGFAGGNGANGAIRVTAIWQQQTGP